MRLLRLDGMHPEVTKATVAAARQRFGPLESSTPPTKAQVSAARAAAGAFGLTIEARSSQNGLSALRTVTTTVGGLPALAIVAMTIGLIRSEAGSDLRTLPPPGRKAAPVDQFGAANSS